MTRPNPPGSPVVLIVEDEPLVRMTNLDILHEAGFRVIDANDADEAFEVLRRRSDVRAVLTDVDMPGSMNGVALAEQVHRRWPHVLLLISSGYGRPHPGEIPDHGQFIPKPYGAATLIRHIHEMMHMPRP